ncbi:MAG TPA: amino acid adenylation domain-containing protein, partial [Ktedonobacteraceae bacterium]|nr:amino acid adenylation domain-containing protein [Ktedonobacteraceae bacterium]
MPLREELARRKQALSSSAQALLERRRKGEEALEAPRQIIAPRPAGETASASFAQQRIWFLQQLEPDSPSYNEHVAIRLRGDFDECLLASALQALLERHETLRTHFVVSAGEVRQVVLSPEQVDLPLTLMDLRNKSEHEQEKVLRARIRAENLQLFDLSAGVLWRTTLFRLDDDHSILLTIMHHIICDAWSIEIFNRELFQFYDDLRTGAGEWLAPLTVQYADFAYWQSACFEQDTRLQKQLEYWEAQLGGSLPVLEMPAARPRPSIQTSAGSHLDLVIPREQYQDLQVFSRQEGGTLFMTLLTAFALTLHHYTHQEDILVGTLIAGRTHPELETIIGYFANTLALRIDLRSNPSVQELFQRVRKVALDAYAHQDLPFERLVEHLQPERSTSHTAVFQTMLILQNVPVAQYQVGELHIAPLAEVEADTAKFDLMVNFQESADGLVGYLEYNTDLFDCDFMQSFANHFRQALAALVANPLQRLAHFPLFSAQERTRLLIDWNDSALDCPTETDFATLFESQVKRTPDAIAVISGHERLSYAELNLRANRLAHNLRAHGVGTDVVVALLAERGWQLLTAILAVFKAGGAYLPLDPHHPASRLALILEDSRCRHVLTTPEFLPTLEIALAEWPAQQRPFIQSIEDVLAQPGNEQNPGLPMTDGQLAYIIYTSGSTGQPKGAMLEQRGMINHLYSKIADLDLTAQDTLAQTASQCFDISVWQFLSPLVVGARVHVFSDPILRDPIAFFQQIQSQRITLLETVPSLLEVALESWQSRGVEHFPALPDLRWLVLTGEALPPELTRTWFQHYLQIPLLNAYGPTECSDDVATAALYKPLPLSAIHTPIGGPVANTRLYVLTPCLEPVPVGVIGELYVGGIGVGRGYWNNVARTAEAFLPDPFSTQHGARLYRTGDKVRWLANGQIEYLGRLDSQVKLRGYRIELGEIEAILSGHPAVRQAVLLIREDRPGEKYLAAYIVLAQSQDPGVAPLRQFLRQRLPEYMVPTSFVFLDALPLSANGKVDRRALPVPKPEEPEEQLHTSCSPLETILLSIWQQALGVECVGLRDSFFDLGGQEFLAARLMASVYETFEVALPLAWFVENPAVAQLVE